MNLYQVGYYRKDAGNVVTFIDSIIVKEEKQHFYELSTDCLVPALKQIKPIKEGMKFILQAVVRKVTIGHYLEQLKPAGIREEEAGIL